MELPDENAGRLFLTSPHGSVARARRLALATVAFGTLFYAIGAALKPGYSSTSQFISELNAAETPWATQLGWFGFVPLGLLFAAFLLIAHPNAQVRGASRTGC